MNSINPNNSMRRQSYFSGGIISELSVNADGEYVMKLRGLEGAFKVPFIKGILPKEGDRIVMDTIYKSRLGNRISMEVYRNGEYAGTFKSRPFVEASQGHERQGRENTPYGSFANAAA